MLTIMDSPLIMLKCSIFNIKMHILIIFACFISESIVSHSAPVRLVNGPTELSGRVEVNHDGQYGTVCDDGFDQNAAQVVCHQLGLSGGIAREAAYYGPGSGTIWIDDVKCQGHEVKLDDCSHNDWGQHDCSHREDAGVQCGKCQGQVGQSHGHVG